MNENVSNTQYDSMTNERLLVNDIQTNQDSNADSPDNNVQKKPKKDRSLKIFKIAGKVFRIIFTLVGTIFLAAISLAGVVSRFNKKDKKDKKE